MSPEVALISLFSAILGILLSNGLSAMIELRRRHTRRLDIVCALHAEILAGLNANQRQLTDEEREYVLRDDSPFGTPDQTDFVFESVKGDLSLLPINVIHPIVQYYRITMQSNLMTLDLRCDDFKVQPPEAKRKFIASLLAVADDQRRAGLKAIIAIEKHGSSYSLDLAEKRRSSVETIKLEGE